MHAYCHRGHLPRPHRTQPDVGQGALMCTCTQTPSPARTGGPVSGWECLCIWSRMTFSLSEEKWQEKEQSRRSLMVTNVTPRPTADLRAPEKELLFPLSQCLSFPSHQVLRPGSSLMPLALTSNSLPSPFGFNTQIHLESSWPPTTSHWTLSATDSQLISWLLLLNPESLSFKRQVKYCPFPAQNPQWLPVFLRKM